VKTRFQSLWVFKRNFHRYAEVVAFYIIVKARVYLAEEIVAAGLCMSEAVAERMRNDTAADEILAAMGAAEVGGAVHGL
jgi:hypothetical protein